nr:MAG TPA_asm: DNA-packaging protein [Bacteriophage sp.]
MDHDVDNKYIYTLDPQRWNSVLLYIYSQVFKPHKNDGIVRRYNEKSNIDYSNRELIDNVCDIYIAMCYEYSKEVSVMGFSKMTGIHIDTLYQWVNSSEVERGSSEVTKRLQAEREESLSNKLASGKGNPVGILGILNRHYGWNMGQPRGQTATQKAPDLPGMAQKYLGNEEPVKNEPVPLELPQADF